MNALRDNDEDGQIITIFRLRHWCEWNEYRSAKPDTVNEQYKLAKLALDEEGKFLQVVGQD